MSSALPIPYRAIIPIFVSIATILIPINSFAVPRQTPVVSTSPDAFQPTYLESIPLQHASAAVVVKTLKANSLPDGIVRVFPDKANKNIVQVLGTQDAIASIRPLITLLDVAPRKVSLEVRILQMRIPAKGKAVTTVIKTGSYTTSNSVPVKVTALSRDTGDTVQLSIEPHLTDTTGKQVTLMLQFGIRFRNGSTVGVGRGVVMKSGAAAQRVIGLTGSTDKSVIKSVVKGEIPQGWRGGPMQIYYVEMQTNPPRKAH